MHKRSSSFVKTELPFMWFRVASVCSEEALSLPPGWFNIVLWHRWDFVIWLWWITWGILQPDGRPTTLSLFYTWEGPEKCVHWRNTKTHSNMPYKNPIKSLCSFTARASVPSSYLSSGLDLWAFGFWVTNRQVMAVYVHEIGLTASCPQGSFFHSMGSWQAAQTWT